MQSDRVQEAVSIYYRCSSRPPSDRTCWKPQREIYPRSSWSGRVGSSSVTRAPLRPQSCPSRRLPRYNRYCQYCLELCGV
ncbi:hypothetical protein O3P69_008571 [Scylla paramamosain]|uniref:Uncharacterized protein n=1 Tax=Scylla paramamosain TaxID=85552 RepID=A0AAW0SMJ3_SCYPA